MEVYNERTEAIIPYGNNAKKHDKKQIANVAESIKRFGFVQPIVVDANNVIVIGHCRWEAAQKLKLGTVPCVRVNTLTPEQVAALRTAAAHDPRTAQRGSDRLRSINASGGAVYLGCLRAKEQ